MAETAIIATSRRSRATRAAWLALGVLALPAAARAATVPFTQALTYADNNEAADPMQGIFQNIIHSAPASPATATYSFANSSGSSLAFASADLATGQLKIQASSTAVAGSPFPPYIQTNAVFGDSFTTTTASGAPFAWTSASTATFSIALSGTLAATRNGEPSTLADGGGSVFVNLALYRKGTVTPTSKLIGDPNAIANYFWTFGGTTAAISYTDSDGNHITLPVTDAYPDLPPVFTADIAPGGDFDWTLLLGASGQPPQSGGSFDVDLSHTLTVSYAGPAGGVTTSESALFTNITPADTAVPEPASAALLAIGLAGCVGARRRRHAACA